MAKKKASKQKSILLGALKSAIPVIKDEEGYAYLRFSISDDGFLMLSGHGPKGTYEEEIPEALVLTPGGPALVVGNFGCVNLSAEPFDFVIDPLLILDALKKAKTDPSILFYGQEKAIEFSWPMYKCYVMRAIQEVAVR